MEIGPTPDETRNGLINKSTTYIIVDRIKYTILLGHYPKGSALEKYAKKNYIDQKGNQRLVWYGEVIKPFVFGTVGLHGPTRLYVLKKIEEYIRSGEIKVAEISDWSQKR